DKEERSLCPPEERRKLPRATRPQSPREGSTPGAAQYPPGGKEALTDGATVNAVELYEGGCPRVRRGPVDDSPRQGGSRRPLRLVNFRRVHRCPRHRLRLAGADRYENRR